MEDDEYEESEEIRHLLLAFQYDGMCEMLELSPLGPIPVTGETTEMMLLNPSQPEPAPVIPAIPVTAVEPKPESSNRAQNGGTGNWQPHFSVAAAYDGTVGAVVLTSVAQNTDIGGDTTSMTASSGNSEGSTSALVMVADSSSMMENDNAPGMLPVPAWVLVTECDLLDCSNCTRYREIVDLNDSITMKLEVHGENDCFSHAVVDLVDNSNPACRIRNVANFSGFSESVIREFLEGYCESRREQDFVLVADTSSHRYSDLRAPPEYNNNNNCKSGDTLNSNLNPPPQEAPPSAALPSVPPVAPPPRPPPTATNTRRRRSPTFPFEKTGIALQRERTGNLQIGDLTPCFHLPITLAARRLNICTTALKKVCRRHGVPRWPYRKVKSTESAITRIMSRCRVAAARASTSNGKQPAAAVPAKILAEIQRLRDERDRACEGWEGRLRRSQAEIRQLAERLQGESNDQAMATRIAIEELLKIVAECKANIAAMKTKRYEDD